MSPRSLPDDPADQVHQAVADARQDFATDVDALLTEVRVFTDSLGDELGRVTREEALRTLRRFILDKFDQRLPLRNLETTLLRQLVREAHDLLTNPETRIDLRDWTRSAEPFLR